MSEQIIIGDTVHYYDDEGRGPYAAIVIDVLNPYPIPQFPFHYLALNLFVIDNVGKTQVKLNVNGVYEVDEKTSRAWIERPKQGESNE